MEIGCESDSKIRTNLIHDVFGYHVTNQRRFSNITRFEAALFSLDFGEKCRPTSFNLKQGAAPDAWP